MESNSQDNLRSNDTGSHRPGETPRPAIQNEERILGAPASDDSPTIISKNHPLVGEQIKAGAPPRENLAASLRGRRLAHFELLEPIGVGGMAAVIRSRDTQLDRFVALKILPPEMATDEENVRRFHQEARAAAKLDHENIARVFFCGEDQRLHFIAFEFVEGENLRSILDRRKRLSVAEAVRYVLQIATGLEHAASRGVVHRDIKPSNIIITPSGRAKLVDMGLARSLEPQQDHQLTQSGVTLGTFDYISPEQALEPRDADSRSDLYSLGCTFYHMLTGKAPVPEGTAAKKLHHHQHVAPVDPRQLNPDVPDEVAAIMGRMMAKEPRDRYQRPIFLVQHLMQIAQKVGAAADLPEGGMIVETPLPAQPRKRPLLIVSLAALALAVQILLITLATQTDGPGPTPLRPGTAPPKDKRIVGKDIVPLPGPIALDKSTPVNSETALKRVFDDGSSDLKVSLVGKIDLGEDGVTYVGGPRRTLEMKSRDPREPATFRFKYQAPDDAFKPLGGLVIDGGEVTIENVRFEIGADRSPSFPVAALIVRGGAKVRLVKCVFIQKDMPQRSFVVAGKRADGPEAGVEDKLPIASVLAEARVDESPPEIIFDRCYFFGTAPGGQAAITVNGPAELELQHCAFKPHGHLFHLRGNTTKETPSRIRLKHCSAFVHNGPAFRVDDDAHCDLQAQYSIFSGPGTKAPPLRAEEPPYFVFQTAKTKPLVRYEGLRNCYDNLYAFWFNDSSDRIPTPVNNFDEFQQLLIAAGGKGDKDAHVRVDLPSIWAAANPLGEGVLPQETFRLRTDLEEVRTTDLKRPLGIEHCAWDDRKIELPPLEPRSVVAGGVKLKANEKLVDPDNDGAQPGVFGTLAGAVSEAKSGDLILVKQSKKGREIEVRPIGLDSNVVDITIKPYPGHQPILTIANTPETDAYFFRIYEGRLHFENMDFILEPDQLNCTSQSVVAMGGNASCTFRDCIITMRPGDRAKLGKTVPLQVVSLLDVDDAKKGAMPLGARGVPEIVFQDSFVRGEGDVLHPRLTRPFDLTLDNSLVAITGSIVSMQASLKEVAADPAASVKFRNVSVFTSNAAIELRWVKNAKGYVPLRVDKATGSIFIALADKPIVSVESQETTEEGLRAIIDWKGGTNGYGPCNRYLESAPGPDMIATIRMEQPDWKTFTGETESQFLKAFSLPMATLNSLWTAVPEQLRAEELAGLGATLDAELLSRLPARKAKGGMAP